MRKKALKKMNPNRGKAYKVLRSKNFTREVIDSAGHSVYLNFTKHLLLMKPYVHMEYQNELARYTQAAFNKPKQESKVEEASVEEKKGEEN